MSRKIAIVALMLVNIIVCPVSQSAAYPAVLKSYRANYTVKYDGIPIGRSITTLVVNAKHYQLCIKNLPTLTLLQGKIEECSQGLRQGTQILPLTYDYVYQRGSQQRHLHIVFNWSNKQAVISANGKQWHTPLLPNTQDKISYQLLLRQGLAAQQTVFNFLVADGGKIKHYQFKVLKTEFLTTPFFQGLTFQLQRSPIQGKEAISLWMAPALQNLVVKVQQQKHFINQGTAELDNYHVNF